MFDLFTGKVQHVPSTPAIPILLSTSIQGIALTTIAVMSMLYAARELPAVPDVLAFVAEMPSAAPPPPPPAAAPPQAQARTAVAQPVPVSPASAPLVAPAQIEPEPAAPAAVDEGVPGGVEGGIAAGVVGGLATTLEGLTAPPPPPAPPVSHEPVRIGGQVQAPALAHRVEPLYPAVAQLANIDGVVILDAVVDGSGHVQTVKVLRGHPLLAKAAIDAVRQWVYEPLRLNGTPTPFELTVSLWFHFDDKAKRRS